MRGAFVLKRQKKRCKGCIHCFPDTRKLQRRLRARAFMNGTGQFNIDSRCRTMADIKRLDGYRGMTGIGRYRRRRREDHQAHGRQNNNGHQSHGMYHNTESRHCQRKVIILDVQAADVRYSGNTLFVIPECLYREYGFNTRFPIKPSGMTV